MSCYLIHFDRPFGHAKHYLGYCADGRLEQRLDEHRRGNGARLMSHVKKAGIGWRLARVWQGADRKRERRLKKRGHAEKCPICRGGWRRPASVKEE